MKKNERPNILLITTDQQRFDTIASHGNQFIYTPHLDWLADEGISFMRAYSDCPICMPARATIMTGKHAFTHGLKGNGTVMTPLALNRTLPAMLTEAGYQTRAQGKMHFHPMRANYGFEHMELCMDYYRQFNPCGGSAYPKAHGIGENETVPVISTVDESKSLTHWTVRRSIDFLETRDRTRPFFMWTSFAKPHPPFDPCANYWALYANRAMRPPAIGDWSSSLESTPQGFLESTYLLDGNYRMSESQLLDLRRAYYACITQIDYQLGLLFARMLEMNLMQDTWIIFTSDHGDMLGDHRMGAKSVFFEGSAHIPLIVRPPAGPWDEKPRAGERSEMLVQLSDIMPSILDIAGIPLKDLDGQSIFDEGRKENDQYFIGQCLDDFFCVMKGQFKYHWTSIGGAELLFDLKNDPLEQRNIADDPNFAGILAELREKLSGHLAKFADKLLKNGKPVSVRAPKKAMQTCKWPGFHSFQVESDVLH